MRRTIAGTVIGYVVIVTCVLATLSLAFLALGADRAFQPNTFDVSTMWLVVSFLLGFVAAMAGGIVCASIAPGRNGPRALAVVVLFLGLLMAIPVVSSSDTEPRVRHASLGTLEAMNSAAQPPWVALSNPFAGLIGVLAGARLRKPKSR